MKLPELKIGDVIDAHIRWACPRKTEFRAGGVIASLEGSSLLADFSGEILYVKLADIKRVNGRAIGELKGMRWPE